MRPDRSYSVLVRLPLVIAGRLHTGIVLEISLAFDILVLNLISESLIVICALFKICLRQVQHGQSHKHLFTSLSFD